MAERLPTHPTHDQFTVGTWNLHYGRGSDDKDFLAPGPSGRLLDIAMVQEAWPDTTFPGSLVHSRSAIAKRAAEAGYYFLAPKTAFDLGFMTPVDGPKLKSTTEYLFRGSFRLRTIKAIGAFWRRATGREPGMHAAEFDLGDSGWMAEVMNIHTIPPITQLATKEELVLMRGVLGQRHPAPPAGSRRIHILGGDVNTVRPKRNRQELQAIGYTSLIPEGEPTYRWSDGHRAFRRVKRRGPQLDILAVAIPEDMELVDCAQVDPLSLTARQIGYTLLNQPSSYSDHNRIIASLWLPRAT